MSFLAAASRLRVLLPVGEAASRQCMEASSKAMACSVHDPASRLFSSTSAAHSQGLKQFFEDPELVKEDTKPLIGEKTASLP